MITFTYTRYVYKFDDFYKFAVYVKVDYIQNTFLWFACIINIIDREMLLKIYSCSNAFLIRESLDQVIKAYQRE